MTENIDDERFYQYLLFIVPALFIIIVKKYITAPRLGFVKFSKERNKKRHTLFRVMTISIIFLLILTTKGLLQQLPMTSLIVGAIGVISSGAYAWLISGMMITVVGIVYLVRFMKKYPLPEKEVNDVTGN